MDGREPSSAAARPNLRAWATILLAIAILIGAAFSLGAFLLRKRPEGWVLTSMVTDGYVASLSSEVPIAAFGSTGFQGPFVMEVAATEDPVDLWLNINGEPVLRARVHEIAYAYPFETDAGNPLSADLILSLPPSVERVEVRISFSVPKGTSPAAFRSAGVSPATVPPRQSAAPVRSAVTAAGHVDPAVTLGVASHSFPHDSTSCWGFTNFTSRGYGWVNVTVPEGVRYYYEIWSEGALPRSLVMGQVEGGTMNHFHWTAEPFDLQLGACKPTAAATFEVAVEGPM